MFTAVKHLFENSKKHVDRAAPKNKKVAQKSEEHDQGATGLQVVSIIYSIFLKPVVVTYFYPYYCPSLIKACKRERERALYHRRANNRERES